MVDGRLFPGTVQLESLQGYLDVGVYTSDWLSLRLSAP
jgi:hypothetical protein